MGINIKNYVNNFMIFSILLFSFSIGTSKAGINISSVFIFLGFLFSFKIKLFTLNKKNITIFFICYGFYIFGSLSSLFHSINDSVIFLNKNSFLLILPIIIIMFEDSKIRKLSINLFMIGIISSALFSIYKFYYVDNLNFDARTLGFMEYSRHINALILALSFSLIENKNSNNHNKFLYLFLIVIFIVSTIISGTRGGWIAFLFILSIYGFIFFRKYLIYSLIISITLLSLVNIYDFNSQILSRFSSITNTHDSSNSIRLRIWHNGIKYIIFTANDNHQNFLLGSGMKNSSIEYQNFVNAQPENIKQDFLIDNTLYGSTDFHNAFIDIIIKSGIIYSLFIFSLIGYSFIFCLKKCKENITFQALSLYFSGMLIITPFYSLFQDYSMHTITFSLALTFSLLNKRGITNESKYNNSRI
jgi:O-antigen ligase